MSHYLIEQIAALGNVEVRTGARRSPPRARRPAAARCASAAPEGEEPLAVDACFVFIGACRAPTGSRASWRATSAASSSPGPTCRQRLAARRATRYLLETPRARRVRGRRRARALDQARGERRRRGLDGGHARPPVPRRRMSERRRRAARDRPVRRARRRGSSSEWAAVVRDRAFEPGEELVGEQGEPARVSCCSRARCAAAGRRRPRRAGRPPAGADLDARDRRADRRPVGRADDVRDGVPARA